MAVVVIDGKIKFMSTNASTLPDNPQGSYGSFGHATIMPGVYHIKSDAVPGHGKYVGFATGTQPNPDNLNKLTSYVPAYRFSGSKGQGVYTYSNCYDSPYGIDIHPGWNKK
jgi:hypothetical protein